MRYYYGQLTKPLQGVYEEVGVMPEAGRTFRLTGKIKF